jgi:hypothetical protein
MRSNTPRMGAVEPIRPSYPFKPQAHGFGSGAIPGTPIVRHSEDDGSDRTKPTLDDFGGRSDALGG